MLNDREDWESENLRGDAYEAVNMIVSNSALDMRSVVVHVLSEALNRYVILCAWELLSLCYILCKSAFACVYFTVSSSLRACVPSYACSTATLSVHLCMYQINECIPKDHLRLISHVCTYASMKTLTDV